MQQIDSIKLLHFILFFIGLQLSIVYSYKNNVCSDFSSYLYADYSRKCYYLKDPYYGMTDRIIFHVKRCETHKVLTADGYMLNIYRMRPPNPKGVVLLQHPLTVNSLVWMMQGNESTALYFYDAGYDVWMPNFRGTDYGNRHVNLTIKDYKFWDFSFHEMGVYDMRAIVDYIYAKTGGQFVYVGHSLSTSVGMIYASMHPELAREKIKVMILLAAVGHMTAIESPTIVFAPFERVGMMFFNFIRLFYPINYPNTDTSSKLMRLNNYFMELNPFKFYFGIAESAGGGWNPREFDPKVANLFTSTFTSSSFKLYQHFAKILNYDKRFRMYDYGKRRNLQLYNSTHPPEYPVEKIVTPILFLSSPNDMFSNAKDLGLLFAQLTPEAKKYGEIYTYFNHFDYHCGKHRITEIYDRVLDFIGTLH